MGRSGNLTGGVRGQPPVSKKPASEANPPVKPETPKEATWGDWAWEGAKWIPGVGAVPSAWDAGAALYNGNYLEAGGHAIDAASNFGGPVGKGIVKGGKFLFKAGEKVAEKLGKKAVQKAEKEAVEDTIKKGGGKFRGGPCDHLKGGDKDSKYKGGSYGGTKGEGPDSHHAPADSASPLKQSQGPAIQMDPADHAMTSSHGSAGLYGEAWRENIRREIAAGNWDEAMRQEMLDIKDVAKNAGDPKKYDEAMRQMKEYYDCLKKNNLLPGMKK